MNFSSFASSSDPFIIELCVHHAPIFLPTQTSLEISHKNLENEFCEGEKERDETADA